jgi:hypothetical protein
MLGKVCDLRFNSVSVQQRHSYSSSGPPLTLLAARPPGSPQIFI